VVEEPEDPELGATALGAVPLHTQSLAAYVVVS
jgi:hypothetical protein